MSDPDERRRTEALAHVRGLLLEAGATEAEIDEAVADDVIDLLAVDRLLLPTKARYTAGEIAERTGLPVDVLRRLWRALGLLDVDDEDPIFTDMDVEAVELFNLMVEAGAADIDTALQRARVIGSSMARIAESEIVPESMAFGSAESDPILAADEFASIAGEMIPAMGWLLEFVWRRHLQAVTRRTMMLRTRGTTSAGGIEMAVGFADMVGFTLLSQHLSRDELAAVVSRFEELAHETVTALGGRIVKMIGDEAMFVVESVEAAARIALGLAEAYADDDLLSDVRVGLAVGPVLMHDADYYGATVNLAHRIVNIANPGTVLVSDEFHSRLQAESPTEFTGRALRPRVLKDLGRVQLWWCGREGAEPAGAGREADHRRNVRWERLADVLRDLEELRGLRERVLSGSSVAGPLAAPLSPPDDAKPQASDSSGPVGRGN